MALLTPGRAAGALALALLAGGCGELVRPSEFIEGDPEQLLVHAVLRAGSDSASVTVSRAGGRAGPVPVHDARVRLVGSAGEALLREDAEERQPCIASLLATGEPAPPRGGCYRGAVPGGIRPGAEYRLEVLLPGGERAQGRTVVPLPPMVQSPTEGLRVPAQASPGIGWLRPDPVLVQWTGVRLAGLRGWSGRLWFRAAATPRCGGAHLYRPGNEPSPFPGEDAGTDSATVELQVGYCDAGPGTEQVRLDSAEVAVAVTAYDSAYLSYVGRWRNGIPDRNARAGLQGAYGIFGSAATTVRRVRLIAQP